MKRRAYLTSFVAALGLVAGLGVVTAASPATADTGPYCTADGVSGCASFRSHGDHFFVCDRRADRHSVTVHYAYHSNNGTVDHTATNYWGPSRYNGCRDINRDLPEGRKVVYEVCLSDYGKPGGRPMKILWNTCGGIISDTA